MWIIAIHTNAYTHIQGEDGSANGGGGGMAEAAEAGAGGMGWYPSARILKVNKERRGA
jgi:hypothetical protein